MLPRVVILRGHQVNPWELRPWEELAGRYDVSYLRSGAGWFDDSLLRLPAAPAKTLRQRLPRGRVGDALVRVPGERYVGLAEHLRGADIVHAPRAGHLVLRAGGGVAGDGLGFRLALTVWETLPFLERLPQHPHPASSTARPTLAATDLYLATTERARDALVLEGAPADRIRVAPPGVDVDRFATARTAAPATDGLPSGAERRPARLGEGPPGRAARGRAAA